MPSFHCAFWRRAPTTAEAQAQIEPVERTIRERLGNLVFGVESEDLEDAVARLLAERNVTLATAESITAGQVASRLGVSRHQRMVSRRHRRISK